MSLDSSVGIVTRLKAGQPRTRGSIPCTGNGFNSSLEVNVGAGVYLASHSTGTAGSLYGDKAVGA